MKCLIRPLLLWMTSLLVGALVHAQSAPHRPAEAAITAWAASSDSMDKLLQTRGVTGTGNETETSASRAGTLAPRPNTPTQIAIAAMSYIGLPYRWGGNSFDTGFDCSGFVRSLYQHTIGKLLPRSAAEQAGQTTPIDKEQLQPGDLVFFNTMRRTFSHVGVYIGEGRFIHSPKPGARVRLEEMSLPYWRQRFTGARRVSED